MKRWIVPAVLLVAAACEQESPTSVGGRLLPPNAIRTFEVVLEPDRFLAFDTAFGLYSLPAETDFGIVAREYRGALNSRVLLRYDMPASIVIRDTMGVVRTDSAPRFIGGDIQLVVDTAASTRTDAVLQLFRTTESWDRISATWNFRVDTGGTRVPWRVPGGSAGALVATTPYPAGADTVLLPVDSLTLRAWAGPADGGNGAIIALATPGTRLRTQLPVLRVRARSSLRPDTIVETVVRPAHTFIFEPEQPDSARAPRVGGTPGWRTIMRLKERLDTVTVPCPVTPNCRLRLGDAAVTYAALQLQPVPGPAGFEPELPLQVVANAVLPQTRVPLQRSPITEAVGGVMSPVPPSQFLTTDASIVELVMTEFLRAAFRAPQEGESLRPTHFALLQSGTVRTFGFGTFAERPRLRLVLSVSGALELP